MPNFKPKMLFPASTSEESGLNGLVFETPGEALDYGRDLLSRWMFPIGHTVVETEDPVNYSYIDHQLVAVTPKQED